MKKELNYYDIYVKVMKREKLTLEEKKIFHEKMVLKNNLIQTLFKKSEERAKKAKECAQLLHRAQQQRRRICKLRDTTSGALQRALSQTTKRH